MVVSDYIAEWLEREDVRHCFGIIGAGNAALFDSISQRGFTQIICVHHEQAAVMASQAYWRACGRSAVSLVTTGGGAANSITGVVGAWMDSIPSFIIAGNEAIDYCEGRNSQWRGWGVQGFDAVEMVKSVTKASRRVRVARQVPRYLDELYQIATTDRPGPVWLEIPRDIQAHEIPKDS